TTIGGLINGQIYQVLALSPNTFSLSAVVDLTTSTGTATNTLTGTGAAISISAIDTVNDIITTAINHGLTDGQTVIYNNSGGSSVPGLIGGTEYRVQVLSATMLKLYQLALDLAPAEDITSGAIGQTL